MLETTIDWPLDQKVTACATFAGSQSALLMSLLTALPNLRHLRMVQAVGKTGGVISAARALHASQPTVTQALANLEGKLGVRLFRRSARGSFPTADGQGYLQDIDSFFDILDKAIAQVLAICPTATRRHVAQAERRLTGAQLRGLIATADQALGAQITRQLGLSPTSLTRAARTLERALGTPLFEDSAHDAVLNSTGAYLARECLAALSTLHLAAPLLPMPNTPCPDLTIGVLPLAAESALAQTMQSFVAAYPRAKVHIMPGEFSTLMEALATSRIDMIFGALPEHAPAGHVCQPVLFHDRYCVVARPGHPLANRCALTADDLAIAQWVVPPVGTPTRRSIEAALRMTRVRPTFCLETSSPTLCRALLLGSDTLTLMPRTHAHQDIECGLLVELHCAVFSDVLYSGVTTRTNWVPNPVQTAFLDALREVATSAVDSSHGTTVTPALPT